MYRTGLLLIIVLLLVSSCTTTPTDPAFQTAGPRPANADEIVMAHLMKRWDFKQMKDFEISKVREGEHWTGLIDQGLVPNWYVCLRYKHKLVPPIGYIKEGPFLVWIRDGGVIGMTHATEDHYSKHVCKITFMSFSFE